MGSQLPSVQNVEHRVHLLQVAAQKDIAGAVRVLPAKRQEREAAESNCSNTHERADRGE